MNQKITIEMPFPPSINDYNKPCKRGNLAVIILSKKARQYRESEPKVIASLGVEQFTGRLKVTVYMTMPSNRPMDVDNYNKGVLDAITRGGLWIDDKQVDILTNVRCGVHKGGRLIVEIEEIERLEEMSLTATKTKEWDYQYPSETNLNQEHF